MSKLQVLAHDLLWFALTDTHLCEFENAADVASLLRNSPPLAVVRRAPCEGSWIPVGLRGTMRCQRYAGRMLSHAVRRRVRPEDLVDVPLKRDLRAFEALARLRERWRGLQWRWGPTGSVGFELASETAVCHSGSDLDVRLLLPRPLSVVDAREILLSSSQLGCPVDIQAETPIGGFALREFIQNKGVCCLLKTNQGAFLARDPWHVSTAQEPLRSAR